MDDDKEDDALTVQVKSAAAGAGDASRTDQESKKGKKREHAAGGAGAGAVGAGAAAAANLSPVVEEQDSGAGDVNADPDAGTDKVDVKPEAGTDKVDAKPEATAVDKNFLTGFTNVGTSMWPAWMKKSDIQKIKGNPDGRKQVGKRAPVTTKFNVEEGKETEKKGKGRKKRAAKSEQKEDKVKNNVAFNFSDPGLFIAFSSSDEQSGLTSVVKYLLIV
eukprot:g1976.t1